MRHALALGLAALLLPAAAAAATVEVRSSVSAVRVGETFDIEIVYDGSEVLGDIATEISFDDSLFDFAGGMFASELGDITGTNEFDDSFGSGLVQVTATSNDDPATLAPLQMSAFTAATLTFEARAPGLGTFAIDEEFSFFGPDFFTSTPVTFTQASTDVLVVAPIPLPAGAVLLLGGLFGLGAVARRKTAARA